MTQIEAMKLALEALKWANKEINEWREEAYGYDAEDQPTIMSAVNAIKEALAQPEQEPVATVAEVHMSRYTIEWTNGPLPEGTKFYTTPPQRKPLTDEQIQTVHDNVPDDYTEDSWVHSFARAIEAAHGIKENT